LFHGLGYVVLNKEIKMFKILYFFSFLATSTLGFAEQAQPMKETILQASEDELAIRAARVELNVALVNRDLKTTVKYWLPEVNTIGGGGSLWAGLDQNIEGFTKIFQDPSFVFGLRTPNNIEVATGGPKEAAETVDWTWQETVKNQDVT
jgi:hypothetical protein